MTSREAILITVIVPAFNSGGYISRCVSSILDQAYLNIELIVVNDCSTDDTAAVIETMASRDDRLKIIHLEDNVGVHEARAIGLRAAQGDYVGFVDSDDWIAPQMYAGLLQAAREHDADIAICGADKVSDNGAFLGAKVKFPYQKVYRENAFSLFCQRKLGSGVLWNKIYRANLIREFGTKPLIRRVDASEDYVVNIGCFANAQCVVTLPSSWYYYLIRPDSASRVDNNGKNFCRILAAYVVCLETYSELTSAQLDEISQLYSDQLCYSDYWVSSRDQLIPHREVLREDLHRLAEVRPEAVYSLVHSFAPLGAKKLSWIRNFVRSCYATGCFFMSKII